VRSRKRNRTPAVSNRHLSPPSLRPIRNGRDTAEHVRDLGPDHGLTARRFAAFRRLTETRSAAFGERGSKTDGIYSRVKKQRTLEASTTVDVEIAAYYIYILYVTGGGSRVDTAEGV